LVGRPMSWLTGSLQRSSEFGTWAREIPEPVGMMMATHKTKTIFDHYNIVNDEDL
jgi:hypothetical protein